MNRVRVTAVCAGAAALWCVGAAGQTLGALGKTYPIAEPHFIAEIQARLLAKERSGELAALQRQQQARARARMIEPPPVTGIETTTRPRTFYLDPTYTLDENIVDANGAVLFPAGTQTNPLQVMRLSRHLLFFDSRDGRQVALAEKLMLEYDGRVKPILVGGRYAELMKRWQTPVYFDQSGHLVRRLQITRVPALVSQEGLRLRVDEVPAR
ncbi:MAG TPA: type-F conjugative transfer system protein TraW [Burkholderiaceae bacterium]|nr:type-F conjugative transfer system protein TraW [Burkholderiaceae bacterium]